MTSFIDKQTMRLQTKILFAILPISTLAIVSLGLWSARTATDAIQASMHSFIENELIHYIDDTLVEYHRTLTQNKLDHVDSFVRSYQQKAMQNSGKIHFFRTGNLLIFDGNHELLYSQNDQMPEDLEPWKRIATQVYNSGNHRIQGINMVSGSKAVYVGQHFVPWNWTVIYSTSTSEIYDSANQIRKATVWVTGFCVLASFLIIYLIFKSFILNPISYLKESANAIADHKQVKAIDIHSRDELGDLARSMEYMADSIQKYRIQQAAWNEDLERKIQTRTQDLIRSEERFRAIFESSTDCILVWDRDHNYIYANQAAIDHVGATRDNVIGKNMRDCLGHIPDFMHLWMKRVDEVFAAGAAMRVEDAVPMGPKHVHSESVLSPIKDGEGGMFAVGVVYRDVSARKEMEQRVSEALDLNKKIISSSAMGILVYQSDGKCILANEAAAGIVGCSQEELISQNFNRLQSWKRSGLLRGAQSVLADGAEQYVEVDVTSTFGRQSYLECHLVRFSLGGAPHLLLVINDVTERKNLEDQLVERNKELERSNQDLDDFAYIASHDLREPLRGIANYSTFLLEDYADLVDGEGRDKLETLIRLSSREESLIEALLHYSRVGRADLAFDEVDLNVVLSEIIDSMLPFLEGQSVDVRIAAFLPTIVCDRIRISEVFKNLVTNAIKYNDKPLKVVDVGCQRATDVDQDADGHTAKPLDAFYVRDNGIGIPERHMSKIFNIFKRLHGRDEYGGGTGAGLTIVKKIIERHNGHIWVESIPDKGTTFYFNLDPDLTRMDHEQ